MPRETPSVEQLLERLAKRDAVIEELSAELEQVRARVAELQARLGQNPR